MLTKSLLALLVTGLTLTAPAANAQFLADRLVPPQTVVQPPIPLVTQPTEPKVFGAEKPRSHLWGLPFGTFPGTPTVLATEQRPANWQRCSRLSETPGRLQITIRQPERLPLISCRFSATLPRKMAGCWRRPRLVNNRMCGRLCSRCTWACFPPKLLLAPEGPWPRRCNPLATPSSTRVRSGTCPPTVTSVQTNVGRRAAAQ